MKKVTPAEAARQALAAEFAEIAKGKAEAEIKAVKAALAEIENGANSAEICPSYDIIWIEETGTLALCKNCSPIHFFYSMNRQVCRHEGWPEKIQESILYDQNRKANYFNAAFGLPAFAFTTV